MTDGGERGLMRLEEELALALSTFDDHDVVILERVGSRRFLQVCGCREREFHAELCSNEFLPPGEWFGEAEAAELLALGWKVPRPGYCPNHWVEREGPAAASAVARLLVRTARERLGVTEAGHLRYKAFRVRGGEMLLPQLGLERSPEAGPGPAAPTSLPCAPACPAPLP